MLLSVRKWNAQIENNIPFRKMLFSVLKWNYLLKNSITFLNYAIAFQKIIFLDGK